MASTANVSPVGKGDGKAQRTVTETFGSKLPLNDHTEALKRSNEKRVQKPPDKGYFDEEGHYHSFLDQKNKPLGLL